MSEYWVPGPKAWLREWKFKEPEPAMMATGVGDLEDHCQVLNGQTMEARLNVKAKPDSKAEKLRPWRRECRYR